MGAQRRGGDLSPEHGERDVRVVAACRVETGDRSPVLADYAGALVDREAADCVRDRSYDVEGKGAVGPSLDGPTS